MPSRKTIERCLTRAAAELFQTVGLVALICGAFCIGVWFWSLADFTHHSLWLLLPVALFLLVCGIGALLTGMIIKGEYETLPAVREDCHE